MKKLLILVLVLGLVSVANAAMTLKISVNGITDIEDSQINIQPSQHLVLDIWSSGYSGVADAMYCALVVDTKLATITGGVVKIPPAPHGAQCRAQAPGRMRIRGLMPTKMALMAVLQEAPSAR